jgi:hypothetical protein
MQAGRTENGLDATADLIDISHRVDGRLASAARPPMRTQTCPGQNRQSLAHHALKIRLTHVGLTSHVLERSARLSLAKSEATQGTESMRVGVCSARVGDAAV